MKKRLSGASLDPPGVDLGRQKDGWSTCHRDGLGEAVLLALCPGELMDALAGDTPIPGELGPRDQPAQVPDMEWMRVPDTDVPAIGATNWAGGLAATEHLLSLGHRRIGAIAGPGDYLCSRARTDGYRSALERAGIKFNPTLVRHGDFQHEAGFVCGGELLGLPEPPTAIFAGSDQQAFGLYEAARQRGLRIPQDLSVVGFDDLPVSRWVPPPLTTVRQPLDEMGRAAAQMLGDLIEGRPLRSSRVELSTELIIRESTAAPTRVCS